MAVAMMIVERMSRHFVVKVQFIGWTIAGTEEIKYWTALAAVTRIQQIAGSHATARSHVQVNAVVRTDAEAFATTPALLQTRHATLRPVSVRKSANPTAKTEFVAKTAVVANVFRDAATMRNVIVMVSASAFTSHVGVSAVARGKPVILTLVTVAYPNAEQKTVEKMVAEGTAVNVTRLLSAATKASVVNLHSVP